MTIRQTGGCLALTVALACAASAQSGVQGDKQFQGALQKEMVDGDLKAAIEEYRKVSARPGVGRELAATSLVRMGECYQKLGDGQARQIYARVVRDFADQPMAAEARARLAAMGGTATARRNDANDVDDRASRAVWSRPHGGIFGGGIVSRDGRLLPYIDWSTGDLGLHDLTDGRDRRLTDTASFADMSRQRYAGYSRISPDGRYVAYGWFNGERYDLRMLDLKAEGIPQPRIAYDNAEVSYIQPFDWSPDGTRLAVQLRRGDRTGQIALMSVSDGTLTPLKSFSWRDQSTNMFFSPDGRSLGYDLPAEDAPGERDVYVLAVDGSRDVRVAPHRRNDEMIGWSSDGKRLLFASDRTGSIQLWAQSLAGIERQELPRVISSEFRGSSKGVTSAGSLYYLTTTHERSPFRTTSFDFESGRATATPADPGEEFYSVNLQSEADWSPDGKSLALNRRDRGGPVGMLVSVLSLDGHRVRHVRPQLNLCCHFIRWGRDSASFIAAGTDLKDRWGLFRVDADSGETTPLMLSSDGESYNAAALSPDGKELYYQHVTPSAVRIVARTLASGVERELVRRTRGPSSVGPNVLAGLHLSPDGQQIVTGTTDPAANVRALLAVSVSSGESRELLRASTGALEVLMWAPDSRSVFVRRPGSGGTPEVLRIPIAGGEPVKIEWTIGHDTRDFRVHPNGRQIVFVQNNADGATAEVRVMPGVAR